MKIGVIFCAWQSADLLPLSLTPWVETKRAQLGGHTFAICAVSVPFEGFPQEGEQDGTRHLLEVCMHGKDIDHAIVSDSPTKETEARGRALRWLVAQGVDAVWQVDSDEVYTTRDIESILYFVGCAVHVTWFRLSLRNAVFNDRTYLVEPFTPPRIHRVCAGAYKAHSFSVDNDIAYGGTITRDIVPQDHFASMTVPTSVAWVKHLTWLDDLRSKRKVEYQTARGWECSFRWDDTQGVERGLQFNEAYYARRGLLLPETVHE